MKLGIKGNNNHTLKEGSACIVWDKINVVSDLKCDSNYTYCYEDILGEMYHLKN